jgi:hypothetical protein
MGWATFWANLSETPLVTLGGGHGRKNARQCDQIWQIFAYWAIFYFGQFRSK